MLPVKLSNEFHALSFMIRWLQLDSKCDIFAVQDKFSLSHIIINKEITSTSVQP